MSLIVAGRFTTFPAAEAAADKLFASGFIDEDVNLFFVNPRGQHARHHHEQLERAASTRSLAAHHHSHSVMLGSVAGAVLGVVIFGGFGTSLPVMVIAAGVGAWLGAFGGQLWQRQRAHEHYARVQHETRNSGVLLAVHVDVENQASAAEILREAGGADIERASGRWQGGHWADFDPTAAPTPYAEFKQQHA